MSNWREQARAIRAEIDERGVIGAVAAAESKESEATLPRQVAFARKMIEDVLIPVLAEFSEIVTRTPSKPVFHEYGARTFGITCDFDSVRFWVKIFLLPDSTVRIAVVLEPSNAEPHCGDFRLSASNEEIERWFGGCLVKMYTDLVPVHGRTPTRVEPIPVGAG